MGQYWLPVNLDRREFLDPHKLGVGLKLKEQAYSQKGTAGALIMLLADMPEPRGGGDFQNVVPGVIGRWKGNRVVLVGDYAAEGEIGFGLYDACGSDEQWIDISDKVAEALEKEWR